MKPIILIIFISFQVINPLHCEVKTNIKTLLERLNHTEESILSLQIDKKNPYKAILENLDEYIKLVELFNDFKQYDIAFTQALENKIKNHDTLSGDEIYFLRRLITIYYKLNDKILSFTQIYDRHEYKMSSDFSNLENKADKVRVNLIWLSGNLLILDHLETIHKMFYETDGNFRRIVKNALVDKNPGQERDTKTLNDLIKVNKYAVKIGSSKDFSNQVNLVREITSELEIYFKDDLLIQKMLEEIVNNKTSQEIAQGRVNFTEDTFSFVDTVYSVFNNTIGWISKVFGNFAGEIRIRTGHLYNNNLALAQAKANLIPLDIILDKSKFVLTDKFIPGYFSHVAIYLGTQEQLEAIEMWNHPDIIPYQEEIAKGNIVLEAVREGVRLSTLKHFLNIDELLIIRKEDSLDDKNLIIDKINRGISQLGKDYDFNFDVSTLDKIVCSELIYIIFGNVHWPTQYRFGRATISPDNIAEIVFQKLSKFKIQSYISENENENDPLINMSLLADKLSYELRDKSGGIISDKNSMDNFYWKKNLKCHQVTVLNHRDFSSSSSRRVCETIYSEYTYEESTY